MGYPVEIHNDYGQTLTVEIRTGNNPNDLGQNALFYQGDLGPDESKTTDNFDPIICFRRSANPDNPGAGLGGWNTFSPDDRNTPKTLELSEAGGA
ncbi:hypothetical protein [Granulicella sp. S190]|uniref:hypothetical protein n=1 Tax=Granulicella sp. S190 TaxID=1747226 RepID=UPI00131AA2B3|nr:hypothetical protein [Granulicella sp. S190]